jgi:hypothetical protein
VLAALACLVSSNETSSLESLYAFASLRVDFADESCCPPQPNDRLLDFRKTTPLRKWYTATLNNESTQPPAMSSPEQRRSNRSSVNGTPRRSARSSQAPASSPALPNNGNADADEHLRSEADDANMQDVTPRGATRSSQNISQSQAPPTSSPLFFRSSPNGSQSQSQQGGRAGGASSPLKSQADGPSSDGARTPRASGMMMGGGEFWEDQVLHTIILMQNRLVTNTLRFQL